MTISEILRQKECAVIFGEVSDFTENYLCEYTKNLNRKSRPDNFLSAKTDIADPVWGHIALSGLEVCVIDSPVVQRLRRIKQLGFADMVYSCADFSRFAHTIGVLAVTSQMSGVIKSRLYERCDTNIDFPKILRMAAIFHDTGHMFFSHVSESFFTYKSFPRSGEVQKTIDFFNKSTSAKAAFHEIISVMIVQSKAVRTLFETLKHLSAQSGTEFYNCSADKLVEYISCFIIGVACDKNMLPYSSILNGSVDADKLDYLFRDSLATGIPISVDISRLIQKLETVEITDFTPPPIWQNTDMLYDTENSIKLIMALKFSAQRIFWQIVMARSIMYETVYMHQKVITAKIMFQNALAEFFKDKDLKFDEILEMTDDFFNSQNLKPFEKTAKIFKDIQNRNLYKRVAIFSYETVEVADYAAFIDSLSDEFLSKINAEYKSLFAKADDAFFAFVNAFVPKTSDSTFNIPIEYGNNTYKTASQIFRSSPLPYLQTQDLSKRRYLVTDAARRDFAYIALERVLAREYGASLSQEACICSKYSAEHIHALKRTL
ncbi:hypothetical protein AGMMS49975_09820 [Clostridia bacterium]|nr:hypothetical protein AGMMS49975_09820 [Clostridia bacterium]